MSRIEEIADQAKQTARQKFGHTMNPMLFSARVFEREFAQLLLTEAADFCEKTGCSVDSQKLKDHLGIRDV